MYILQHKSQHTEIMLQNDIRARVTDLIMFWENLTGVDASSKHVYVDQDIGSKAVTIDKCCNARLESIFNKCCDRISILIMYIVSSNSNQLNILSWNHIPKKKVYLQGVNLINASCGLVNKDWPKLEYQWIERVRKLTLTY